MNAAEMILREIQEVVDKWPDFDGGVFISDKIKAYFMAREIVADVVDVVDMVIDNMIIEKPIE